MKKSPAENKQGQSVEDIFRDGFSEAESAPPPRIWENVHLELENHELHRYRKQATWYRSMAAAFLLLLVSAGIILWQQKPTLVGQQEIKFAKQSKKIGRTSPSGLASKASIVQKEQFENKAQVSQPSVSRAFSGNRPQNRNQPQNGNKSIVASFGARKRSLPQPEKASVEVMARQKPAAELPISTVPLAELSLLEGNEAAGKGETESQSITSVNVGEKPLSRAIINSLAASKSLPSLIDPLQSVSKKSILVQEEAEPALPQTQPTETGNESELAGVSKWSVTMAYSPQYAYAPVKIGNNSSLASAVPLNQTQGYQQQYAAAIDEYNRSYTPTYSYSALVGTSYKINEKWQLESGVLYTQKEATTTHSYLFYGPSYFGANSPGNTYADYNKSMPLVNAFASESSAQPVYVTRTDEYKTNYKYQQIGLPLRLAYRLNLKKVYALFSGGVNMNLLVQNAILPETNQVQAVKFGLKDKDSPFRTLQWATSTSVGIGYDVTKKMSIVVAPEFTYSLTSMMREEQQQANTYQFGVSIGGRWRLTK